MANHGCVSEFPCTAMELRNVYEDVYCSVLFCIKRVDKRCIASGCDMLPEHLVYAKWLIQKIVYLSSKHASVLKSGILDIKPRTFIVGLIYENNLYFS